jgi:hypothetical protein
MEENQDVEVSTKGVILRGAYADLRPAIKRSVDVAETVLSVIDNLVGLPADFLNHHLSTFRERYRQRIEEIPPERRDVPPLRIGCSILKEVAFAAEEPEIQKMFADLLGTSSDTSTQYLAHPGFADVINQMLPLDAKILRAIIDPTKSIARTIPYYNLASHFNPQKEHAVATQLRTSVDNLVRLGLLDWKLKGVTSTEAIRLRQLRTYNGFGGLSNDTSRAIRDLKDSVRTIDTSFQQFSNQISRMLENFSDRTLLTSTEFGRQFIIACCRDGDTISD